MVVVAPIKISSPPKRYPPVGHCIYCGVYTKQLTNEHIIPHGLAGNSLILPKSSCRDCADKTRNWETACLRHLWWPFRTHIGAPTSGKQKPENFLIRQMKITKLGADGSTIEAYDKIAEFAVSPEEYPLVYMAYKLPEPGVLVGRSPDTEIKYEAFCRIDENAFRRYAPGDKYGFQLAPLNPDAYVRMLAKIAHAYAVAELGEKAFWPKLTRFIRGHRLKSLHWIGGNMNVPDLSPQFHDIRWHIDAFSGVHYLVVSLRLFSFFGGPQYHIVVGELARPIEEFSRLEQPLYTIDIELPGPVRRLVPFGDQIGGTWD
jgi:hypothetical protein